MKSQVLHTVWCNISGEAAGTIWHWSLLGVKGLNVAKCNFGKVNLATRWPAVIPRELGQPLVVSGALALLACARSSRIVCCLAPALFRPSPLPFGKYRFCISNAKPGQSWTKLSGQFPESNLSLKQTCELATTWLASSLMGNETPSSDAKEVMGLRVPDVSTMERARRPSSENTCNHGNAYRQISTQWGAHALAQSMNQPGRLLVYHTFTWVERREKEGEEICWGTELPGIHAGLNEAYERREREDGCMNGWMIERR